MSRSQKIHYPEDPDYTLCRISLRKSLAARVTTDPTRVTCKRCLDRLPEPPEVSGNTLTPTGKAEEDADAINAAWDKP